MKKDLRQVEHLFQEWRNRRTNDQMKADCGGFRSFWGGLSCLYCLESALLILIRLYPRPNVSNRRMKKQQMILMSSSHSPICLDWASLTIPTWPAWTLGSEWKEASGDLDMNSHHPARDQIIDLKQWLPFHSILASPWLVNEEKHPWSRPRRINRREKQEIKVSDTSWSEQNTKHA